jgi:hypothetical protein
VSWSKEDAALSFASYFAELTDADLLNEQWDFERLDDLRQQAKIIIAMYDQ